MILVPKHLKYPLLASSQCAEEEPKPPGDTGVEVKMHPIHMVWCKDRKEWAETMKVQEFLKHLRWQEAETGEGGITWLELFALYSVHGGSKDEEDRRTNDRLRAPPMLQMQLATFKKAARKINLHTVQEQQAWRLETSYVMRNRLQQATITNRQPAVRGMPVLTIEDAGKVMHTLLALQGHHKAKTIQAWKEGTLKVEIGDLKLQGTAQKWRHTVKQGEVWNLVELSRARALDGLSEAGSAKDLRRVPPPSRHRALDGLEAAGGG